MKISKKRDEIMKREQEIQTERRAAPVVRVRSNVRAGLTNEAIVCC